MNNTELLTKIKSAGGITGEYQDEMLTIYMEDVKQYLLDGGVDGDTLELDKSAGAIIRGTLDLFWHGTLSDYFYQRVTQLKHKGADSDV